MGMHRDRRKLIAAGASTVTSAAFQLSVPIWPDFIVQHKHFVLLLWIVSAALWIWWLISSDKRPLGSDSARVYGVRGKGSIGEADIDNLKTIGTPPSGVDIGWIDLHEGAKIGKLKMSNSTIHFGDQDK